MAHGEIPNQAILDPNLLLAQTRCHRTILNDRIDHQPFVHLTL